MAYDGHFLWRPPTALASMYIPRGNPLTTPFLSQIPVLTYEYEHTYNWRQPEQFTTQEHILNHDLDHRENMKWRKFLFRRSPKKESNTDGGYNNSRRYRGKGEIV